MLFQQYYKLNLIAFVMLCLSLAGCAISNEGATDYRFFGSKEENNQSPKYIYQRGKYIKPSKAFNPIKPGEPLVVSIKQVYINSFIEWPSPMRWVRNEPASGEIAIVVNAFEKGGEQRLDFGPDGKSKARVVFYSDDVWKGQFLNLAGLSTIYGPLKYEGSPFILDLYVVELDAPGAQQKQLISNLAAIGATFYPPSSPFVGPLAKLANTFITDDQDDRAFHYTMELRPEGGNPALNTGMLQAGHYAFIREEHRKTDTTPWEKLGIDENTSKIVYLADCKPDENTKEYPENCYYKENSYVVIEVNTAASSLANDTQQMIYSTLAGKISETSPPIMKEDVPVETLNELSTAIAATRFADTINAGIQILESSDSEAKKRITAISIIDDWCEVNSGSNVNKYTLTSEDNKRIETRFLSLVSSCETDVDIILKTMNSLKNRQSCSSEKSELVRAISC